MAKVAGTCPVYKAGDCFRLKDSRQLVWDIPLCMHTLSVFIPFLNALRVCESE